MFLYLYERISVPSRSVMKGKEGSSEKAMLRVIAILKL